MDYVKMVYGKSFRYLLYCAKKGVCYFKNLFGIAKLKYIKKNEKGVGGNFVVVR